VIYDPSDYDFLIENLKNNKGTTTAEFRQRMAIKTFTRTSSYDKAIVKFLAAAGQAEQDQFDNSISLNLNLKQTLRYGENPHQKAAMYIDSGSEEISLGNAEVLSGKELSFNNFWDLEAALHMALDYNEPFAAVIKHTNPCGAATGETLAEAYHKALASDPLSAFGSIISLNRVVDIDTARLLHETQFIECILAPGYQPEAFELLKKKKQRRLVAVGDLKAKPRPAYDIRMIAGGALVQSSDLMAVSQADLKTVTKTEPSEDQIRDLLFAFKIVKHVKSNAVLLCKDCATVGVGAGQTSRVDSSIIAVRKAGERTKGAVAASDAFFPMPDGLETLAEAGITAVIQPGGSKGDPAVIEAADKYNVAMVFTGFRHFKHKRLVLIGRDLYR